MLDIKCIGTGSSGNAYLVKCNGNQILLDAGLPLTVIQKASGYNLMAIDAAFITHEHGDHSKSVRDLIKRGIRTYMSLGTAEALKVGWHPMVECFHACGRYYQLGHTPIKWGMFHVDHDAEEPVGFVFRFEETGERLVYITDAYECTNVFRGLTHIMIECNFDDDTMKASDIDEARKKRTVDYHMSLEKCLEFLDRQDLSKVKCIYLLHMSDTNANEAMIRRNVQKHTGKMVKVF